MHHRTGILILVCLGLYACSSDSTPSGGGATAGAAGAAGASAGGAAGTGGAAGAAGASGAAGAGGAVCDSAKLVGKWAGSNYSMEILSDWTYQASGTPNMASIDVTGTVQVDNCDIKLTDISGQFACLPEQVGEYGFTVSDTTLTFTLVSDACDGRRIPLTKGPLTKF